MAFDFCIPTKATIFPASSDWLHEVKYDGYRLRLEGDGDRVRLMTRAAKSPLLVKADIEQPCRKDRS